MPVYTVGTMQKLSDIHQIQLSFSLVSFSLCTQYLKNTVLNFDMPICTNGQTEYAYKIIIFT